MMGHKYKSEKELILALKKKDEKAFEYLIDNYGGIVYKILSDYSLSKEDKEDLFSEIFVKIYMKISDFRGESKLSVWIYKIAINRLRNYLRDNFKIKFTDFDENYPDSSKTYEEKYNTESKRRFIEKFIDKLPINQKLVLNLYYFDSCTYKEISEITGISLANVKTYLHRAKKKLAEMLSNYEKELL